MSSCELHILVGDAGVVLLCWLRAACIIHIYYDAVFINVVQFNMSNWYVSCCVSISTLFYMLVWKIIGCWCSLTVCLVLFISYNQESSSSSSSYFIYWYTSNYVIRRPFMLMLSYSYHWLCVCGVSVWLWEFIVIHIFFGRKNNFFFGKGGGGEKNGKKFFL